MHGIDPLFLHLMVLGASDFFVTAEPLIRELVPSNANMEKPAASFHEFLVQILTEGLRKNEPEERRRPRRPIYNSFN